MIPREKRNKKKPLLDKEEEFKYEDNIPEGFRIDPKEVMSLFIELYGRQCLEKCGDLYESEHGSSGRKGPVSSDTTGDL